MSQTWSTQQEPQTELTFDQLASKLSRGLISDSTWVVSKITQSRQQVFDIPGLERAARKITQQHRQPTVHKHSSHDVSSKTVACNVSATPTRSAGSLTTIIAAVAKLVLHTRPNKAFVFLAIGLLVGCVGVWNYSRSELMRFPRAETSINIRVLPIVGDVPRSDFWVVQGCLVLASIAAFEVSILRGQKNG